MEPLSVAVHAVNTLAQLRANQTVAIFGCGPVGLLCMAVAKALGASRIIAVGIGLGAEKLGRTISDKRLERKEKKAIAVCPLLSQILQLVC